jgi:WD40 repeat protein
LVVTNAPAFSRETAELVHEALIRHWPKLVDWISRDRAFQSWLRQIRSNVELWSADPSDDGPLLRSGMLALARDWLSRRRDDLSLAEQGYVEASRALQQQVEQEQEAARRAEIRRQQELAEVATSLAREQRRSHGSWVWSLATLPDGRLASGGGDGKIKLWPKDGAGEPVVLGPFEPVRSLAVLADRRLASGGEYGAIHLWPKDGAGEPVVLSQNSGLYSLAVLADGRLASGGNDGKINLWPKDGTGEPMVLAHGSPVRSLAVLADGRLAHVTGGRHRAHRAVPGIDCGEWCADPRQPESGG